MSTTDWISIASFLLVGAAYIWGGIFRFSGLEHKIDTLSKKIDILGNNALRFEAKVDARFEKMEVRFEKIENKIESVRLDLHKIDIRVTKLEQPKQNS